MLVTNCYCCKLIVVGCINILREGLERIVSRIDFSRFKFFSKFILVNRRRIDLTEILGSRIFEMMLCKAVKSEYTGKDCKDVFHKDVDCSLR